MQISDTEVKKILGKSGLVREIDQVAEARQHAEDAELVTKVVGDVVEMTDREERIAELKARIEAGDYNPAAEDIADAMIRRSIADNMR